MIDLKRTHCQTTLSRAMATGTVIDQEGVLLCASLENGEEKAKLFATVAGTEKVIGFAKTANSTPSVTSKVESVLVPGPLAASFTAQLSEANIVVTAIRVVIHTTGGALNIITVGVPASGEVLVATSGLLTFHADQAGLLMDVTYLFSLTLVQSRQRYGERFIGNRDLNALFGNIEIGVGYVEIYTDQFDAAAAWGSGPVKLGPNGTLVMSGAGPVLNLVVVHVPSAELPMLGLRGTL